MPARKTCRRGHPRNRVNTYVQPDGKLICRVCRADTYQTWRRERLKSAGLPPPGHLAEVCRNGHPRTDANTKIRTAKGTRECLICRAASHARQRDRQPIAGSQSGFTCKETINDTNRSIHSH